MLIPILLLIIIPIFTGVCSTGVTALIGRTTVQDSKKRLGSIFLSVAIGTFGLIIFVGMMVKPYTVNGFSWCQETNGDIRINGRLVDRFTTDPKQGEIVQIQVFRLDTNDSVATPLFATTDIDGQFLALLTDLRQSSDGYVINFVYWYDNILEQEKWGKKDFKRSSLPSCP